MGVHLHGVGVGGREEGDGKGLEAGKIGFQSQLCHSS